MQKPSVARVLLVCLLIFSLVGIANEFFLSNSLHLNPWTFFNAGFSSDLQALTKNSLFYVSVPSDEKESQQLLSGDKKQRITDSKIVSITPPKVPRVNTRFRVIQNVKKLQPPVYRKGKVFAQQNRKVPVSLPTPLEGRPENDPSWCTMGDYRKDYWEENESLEKESDHDLLQNLEISFPAACVRDGILHVHKDSPDIWKLSKPHNYWLVSGYAHDGSVRTLSWKRVLLPYIKIVEEDMTKWGLPMDQADALVSISNYVEYLAEFYKNGVVYLWALFKHRIITENMWFVPLFPNPPGQPLGYLPAYIEALIRPFTKRCLMRFSAWIQHNRCYPRVHIRHWTSTNWTQHYPWEFQEEYIQVANTTLDYYEITNDRRPLSGLKIGIIKRSRMRRALNHDELVKKCNEDIVAPDGGKVECVSLEIAVTDVTTMKLIRTLNVLVGVHGAGLLNGIFMNPGSGILELFPVKVAKWNFHTYPNDLKIRDSPRLHYEGLHICDIGLTAGERPIYPDRRWQTTAQVFPWEYVRRRLQNVVNHLAEKTYPIIVESVPGKLISPACSLGTTVSYTEAQLESKRDGPPITHEYLGLPIGANWTVKTLDPDKRR